MNRLLLWRMLQEEVRLNSSFASRRGFWLFPSSAQGCSQPRWRRS